MAAGGSIYYEEQPVSFATKTPGDCLTAGQKHPVLVSTNSAGDGWTFPWKTPGFSLQ